MVVRVLPLVIALLFGWNLSRHRVVLLIAVACWVFAVVFTFAYIYPINAVLFAQAGGNQTAAEITDMVHRWIFADRLRFAVGVVGFLSVLWAFRLPIPDR